MAYFAELSTRGTITVAGPDRFDFLQGLVSNDISPVANGNPVWAAVLTPQGKYRHDFFAVGRGDELLLDCEGGDRMMDLGRMLRRYVLRAAVSLDIDPSISCFVIWGDDAAEVLELDLRNDTISYSGGLLFPDPRLPEMGFRLLTSAAIARATLTEARLGEADETDWDAHRIPLGIPNGARDMQPNKAILLENGFEELHGVDWEKGCYLGQELTARTKYRGLVKKRLLPVRLIGPAPEEGTQVIANGKDAGTLYSIAGDRGLALLRLSSIDGRAELVADEATLVPEFPEWMELSK